MLEAVRREPALKAQHAHPGVCPVQPALECIGLFPGLPDADISGVLRRDDAAEFAAVNCFGQRGKKREGSKERDESASSPIQKPSL